MDGIAKCHEIAPRNELPWLTSLFLACFCFIFSFLVLFIFTGGSAKNSQFFATIPRVAMVETRAFVGISTGKLYQKATTAWSQNELDPLFTGRGFFFGFP